PLSLHDALPIWPGYARGQLSVTGRSRTADRCNPTKHSKRMGSRQSGTLRKLARARSKGTLVIDPVEDCVSRALQRHADKVPLGRDVSGPAIQRALQIRRRRRAAGAVAGLALLGGLIPVGVELAGPPNDRAEVDYAMPNTSEAVDGDASVADPPTGTTRPSVPSRDARDDDRSDRSAEPTEPEPPEY